jgi:hypothetical protein
MKMPPFNEGMQARSRGFREEANPYDKLGDADQLACFLAWCRGFNWGVK